MHGTAYQFYARRDVGVMHRSAANTDLPLDRRPITPRRRRGACIYIYTHIYTYTHARARVHQRYRIRSWRVERRRGRAQSATGTWFRGGTREGTEWRTPSQQPPPQVTFSYLPHARARTRIHTRFIFKTIGVPEREHSCTYMFGIIIIINIKKKVYSRRRTRTHTRNNIPFDDMCNGCNHWRLYRIPPTTGSTVCHINFERLKSSGTWPPPPRWCYLKIKFVSEGLRVSCASAKPSPQFKIREI